METSVPLSRDAACLRDVELAYLDHLLARYRGWRKRAIPPAGIVETRAAVDKSPRADQLTPLIPLAYASLAERGFGSLEEMRREPVGDLRQAIAKQRRIALLGDPGSGKTTTLWRLAHDYARAAREDAHAPLPLLVPLGGYTGDSPFEAYMASHLGPLGAHLSAYRTWGRLILLLDGLNEMPRTGYVERVGRIRSVLNAYPDETVVAACRKLEDAVELEDLRWIEVSPLDRDRMLDYLRDYLGENAGERLFWEMAGGDEVRDLWRIWQEARRTWVEFWSARRAPLDVAARMTMRQHSLYTRLRRDPPPLLSLGSNPFRLRMMAQVYACTEGALPANRAQLFEAFVDTLLEREKGRCDGTWIEASTQVDGLAALAYAMQTARGAQGTTASREQALAWLGEAVPDCNPDRVLSLATSATLLRAGDSTVRFCHPLLQAYLSARGLMARAAQDESLARYWPSGWWEPCGWEEPFILLAGMELDASRWLGDLAKANPLVAARCLLEGGADAGEAVRNVVVEALVAAVRDAAPPPAARVQAGDRLARLGDPRPGVGLRSYGLPDIAWCEVPAGPFRMGSSQTDKRADKNERPQHTVELPAFRIARYPVTNEQYAAFVRDGGYTARWRACWTDAGWGWKADRARPRTFGGAFDLPNHPVVMVTWHEAVAFGRWLTARLQTTGDIKANEAVTLPTEAQWEKAARGTDGRRYGWGNEADPNRANCRDMGIRSTSAVGCFPGGASPCGALDMGGNVWEWTGSLWGTDWQNSHYTYPYDLGDGREVLDAGDAVRRVVRGGSFDDGFRFYARCAVRYRSLPFNARGNYGFRVVVCPLY